MPRPAHGSFVASQADCSPYRANLDVEWNEVMDSMKEQAVADIRLGRYAIDTQKSSVKFSGRHMFGLLPVRGTFRIGSGTVTVAEPVTDSKVRAEVDAASFHTGHDRRDTDVRSASFLDAERHPVITFESDRVEADNIIGTLTVRGVSRPVTLVVEATGATASEFTARATTRIDRRNFGVTGAPGLAGRHLDLTLDLTCRLA
jgi:polyisoprenoid-binding protein YceI